MRGRILLFVVVAVLAPATGTCRDFRFGDVEGLFNVTAAYGLLTRVADSDENQVAVSSGGDAPSANFDDGTQNYDTGIVSNMARLTGELVLRRGVFGAYVRGYGFYDYENQDRNRERTQLSDGAEDLVGKDADLLDHYVSAHFRLNGMPLQFRLGDQVLNWGQTSFVRDGIDVINPIDAVAAFQPASTVEDLFIPLGMLWGAANLTQTIAVEGYYQYEWKRARVQPVGSLFSTSDAFGDEGTNFIMLGAGQSSDLGTDLDEAFGLPEDTLGFDADFNKLPGRGVRNADDNGQFGMTLSAVLPGSRSTRMGAHYVRYHTRLPIISGITASQAAIDATSSEAVAARAAVLEPIYESTGLTQEEAAEEALSTAESLTLSGYTNEAGYFVEYPEDVDMVGITLNTATLRTGTLLSAELSHHLDFPFQLDTDQVINGVLSPVQYDPDIGQGSLGEFGADEVVGGFKRLDKTQASFGVTHLFSGRLGASQVVVSGDAAWIHVHDMPNGSETPLSAIGGADEDSWGYRFLLQLNYNGLFGGLNLRPRLLFTHDIEGNTPAPFGTFVEERKSVSVGVGADYVNAWTADLSYTNFFGGGVENRLNDRDFIKLRISYSF